MTCFRRIIAVKGTGPSPRWILKCFTVATLLISPISQALDKEGLEQTILESLTQFHTPGMAVGIIKDGEPYYLKGHGIADKEAQEAVTKSTYFRLGSTTKAFTALQMAIQIDRSELAWDSKVSKHLPLFELYNKEVTEAFTITDLLTHRSGLYSGAGDSLLWPAPSGFTVPDIVQKMRFFTPTKKFRSQYSYSNTLYITAAYLAEKTALKPWAELVDSQIFAPLDMQCYAGGVVQNAKTRVAKPYGFTEKHGPFLIYRNQISSNTIVSAPAGGIVCSAEEMLKWLTFWLDTANNVQTPQMPSPKSLKKLLKAQTQLPVSAKDKKWNNTQSKQYGLGWRIMDIHGENVYSHTGTLSGFQSYVAFIPEKNFAAVILNNGSNYAARTAVMQYIFDNYINEKPAIANWVEELHIDFHEREQRYLKKYQIPEGKQTLAFPLQTYSGVFEDKWFGKATIEINNSILTISMDKMPSLVGELSVFDEHQFVVHWHDPNAARDTLLEFKVSPDGDIQSFTLVPLLTPVPENHEYTDMIFAKTNQEKDKIINYSY